MVLQSQGPWGVWHTEEMDNSEMLNFQNNNANEYQVN